MLALPLGLLGTNFSSILLGLRRISTLSGLRVFQAAVLIPLLLIFVKWSALGVSGAIIASVAASICFVVATAAYLRREGASFAPRFDRPVAKSTLDYGLRGYVGNLLQFFNYRLDSFLVNSFIGSAGVGIYSAAIVLAELLWQLPNSVGLVILPKAANSDAKEMNRFTPRVFWAVLLISALAAAAMGVAGKLIIRAVFSDRFLDAYRPLLALLPGVVLLGAGKVLTNDMAGRGYPHYNSIVAGIALLVTLGLDLALIPRMGVLGAALASTVAYSSTFLLSLVLYMSVRRRPIIDVVHP
jgi:O-antigen/teichoic acid export membrane protein